MVYSASGIRYVQVCAEMYGTAESRFHTPLTTTLGRGERNVRCSASAGASASQAVGTPEMVTPETLKRMVLLVEDGLVDVTG